MTTRTTKLPAKTQKQLKPPESERLLLMVCLARLLNEELKERGWSQDELSKRTGASRSAINGWIRERAGAGLDIVMINRLVQALYPKEHPALGFATLCTKLARHANDVYVEHRLMVDRHSIGVPGTKGAINPAAAGLSVPSTLAVAPQGWLATLPQLPPPPPPAQRGRPKGRKTGQRPGGGE